MTPTARKRILAALALLAIPGLAPADEILFNNGDRLTGTVVSAEGGKLKIQTAVAGEVTVDMAGVKTFTTDKPIEIRKKDNDEAVLSAPAAKSETAGAVTIDGTEVPLTDVKYVNLNQTWSGSVVAGAMFARGNTYADQVNVSFDALRRTIDDRITLNGAYNFGRQEDDDTGDKETSVDNWFAAGKYDYFFTDKFYGYASLRYEKDRIADLERRVVPSVGVGYLWYDEADFKFDTEAGLAYVGEKYEDGSSNDAMSLRLAYHLKKDFWNDKVQLFHNLEYFPSLERLDDYLVLTDAGVRTAITEKMFAEYKIEWRYDATPSDGQGKNDYRHIVGVGWKF